MKALAATLAIGFLAVPAWAQTPAPPSDTIREVTTKGVTISVGGMDIDVDYKADGTFVGGGGQFAGTWKADGKKLCLTIPGMVDNQCIEYPDGKKSGDTFDIVTDMGALTVAIH